MNPNSSSGSSWGMPAMFEFRPCWENAGMISDNNLAMTAEAVGSSFRPCKTALPVFTSSQGMLRPFGLHGSVDLNLGVRTYFPSDDLPAAERLMKRPRFNSPATQVPCCQVDGCNADLRCAPKHYHRRHKVCELHSKAASVFSGGQTQRFCQQCSRFHPLSEFDDAKRSCRKRLADHNRRRRKIISHPDQETQSFMNQITGDKASEADCEGNLYCAIHQGLHHANQLSRISSMLESLEQQRETMKRVESGGDEALQFLHSHPSPITTLMDNSLHLFQHEHPHMPFLDLQQALKHFGASMYH